MDNPEQKNRKLLDACKVILKYLTSGDGYSICPDCTPNKTCKCSFNDFRHAIANAEEATPFGRSEGHDLSNNSI